MSVGSVAPDRRRWVSTGASILSLTKDPPSLSIFPFERGGCLLKRSHFLAPALAVRPSIQNLLLCT